MSKYLVQYGIVNYYSVVIEANSPEDAERKVTKLMPTELDDLGAEFESWDMVSVQANEDELIFED